MLERITPRRTSALSMGLAVLAASCSLEPSGQDVAVSLVGVEAPGGGGPPPKVKSTDPEGSPPDVTLNVRILGSGYDAQSVAAFLLAGTSVPDVTVNSTAFVSETELIANLTIGATAIEAFYDVEVRNGRGKRGVGIELFEIGALDPGGAADPVVTTFRDGSDPIRSDFDNGGSSRSYRTGRQRSKTISEVTQDGRQWLALGKDREACVDFPTAGPDAQIFSQSDWNDLIALSDGEVGLGQRWCGAVTMHSRDHSDPGKLFDLDTDPTTPVDDVQVSGGKLVMKGYGPPQVGWPWRLIFDDNRTAINGGDRYNGLCIRIDSFGVYTLGTDPTIEADALDPAGGVCSAVDEYVNLVRFTVDKVFVHVARFRMPFRYTLVPE